MSRIRIAALLAVIALIPAAAEAQSTITACYVPKTGSVYRIKAPGAPDACKSSHVEFSWQSGGMEFNTRESPSETVSPNSFEQMTASCQPGEYVVSGGWASYPNLAITVVASMPASPPAQGWFVDARNLSSIDIEVWAFAICAKPAG